jgi:hypothetical protein
VWSCATGQVGKRGGLAVELLLNSRQDVASTATKLGTSGAAERGAAQRALQRPGVLHPRP